MSQPTHSKWYRICSHCNGIIHKGEGIQVARCRNEGTIFWHHKDIKLCEEHEERHQK